MNTDMQIKAMTYLVRPNDTVAIRGLRTNNNGSYERVFQDMTQAVQYGNQLAASSGIKGVYFTVNPLHDDYDGTFAKDSDIKQRTTLFIDIDAVRRPQPPLEGHKVSSTQAELDATIELAREIVDYMSDFGVTQQPILAISGNGTHLYYSIDMPNDEASLDTLKYFLKQIGLVFNGERGDVDMTIRNAARIAKLTGTWATKGEDNVEEGRCHREARIIQWPTSDAAAWQADTVDSKNIEAIASIAREAEQAEKRAKASQRKSASRSGWPTTTPSIPQVPNQKAGENMSSTFTSKNDFLLNNINLWLPEAYKTIASPDDRNQWLGMLTSVKAIQGEAGWAMFDSWCSSSAHYDENSNREAWDAPASCEDVPTETLKLAYSMMKLGFDVDALAITLGIELSKETLMSIDAIKAAIQANADLTVRWAWSARCQSYYPAGVWPVDISKRRLTHLDHNLKLQTLQTIFFSTENDNGYLKPIKPFVMTATDDLYTFDETCGIWQRLELKDVNSILLSMAGFTMTGKKNGRETHLQVTDPARESRQLLAVISDLSPRCEKKLAFNNTALVYNGNQVVQRKAAASDMFTHKMDMDYVGSTPTPEFDSILHRLFEGDAERIECYLQWAGSTIMGANIGLQIPMMFLISEVGGTGKSMLLQLLERIVGSQQTSNPKMSDLKDRGILIALANSALVVDYDINLDAMVDNLDVLKKLIMGEAIEQRQVGTKQTVKVAYRGAVCGAANGTPTFKSYDSGLDRRILIIPTTNRVVTKSEMVREYDRKVFEKEGAGIVFKMVEAFKRMLVAGELVIPQACQEAKEAFRAEVDAMSTWFEASYAFDCNAKVMTARDLYASYCVWCQHSNHSTVSISRFTRDMKSKARISGGGEDMLGKRDGVNGFRVNSKAAIGFEI